MTTGADRFTAEWLGGADGVADRIAVVDGASTLSYAKIRERVALMSLGLRRHGVLPGDRVALVLENSWQYVVSYLAVLSVGAVVVPLAHAARERDLLTWIRFVDARLVIADPDHAACPVIGVAMPGRCLSATALLDAPPADAREEAAEFHPSADSPAAILFTSGTTGAPKGIVLTHGNLRANTLDIIESLSLRADDRVMAALPFTYAYGSSVLLSHLACGGCVVIQRGFVFPEAVVESMTRERVTGFAGVPSTFALLLSRVDLGNHDLSALRYVTQAGGPMSAALTQRLVQALPGKQVFVMYGQTEATSRISCLPPDKLAAKTGSVGLPLRQVTIQIRDADGGECPAGQTGEIWVRGPNVMMGYWRDAEATDKVLRDGWLKTGDLGYRDADGYLFIVGRRSDMIKVGAHRVAPQDVEDVLAELPGVADCAVVGIEDAILGEAIKAFIVRPADSVLREIQVKRHCLENLAAYKVPKFVEFVESLPRTSSGKVQRSRLLGSKETIG